MSLLSRRLNGWVAQLEGAQRLDKPAAAVSTALGRLLPNGVVRDALSGTWLGHPLHPLVVALPIGAWTSASVLDFGGQQPAAARRLVGIGLLSAGVAVASGGSDFVDTTGAERRVGFVHWAGAWTSIGWYARSWWKRGHGRSGRSEALAGAATLAAAGYLGGHLAYAMGVGVDTTAFMSGPEHWVGVAPDSELVEGEVKQISIDGVAIALVRVDGQVHALADRCTHRGGPLSEGKLVGRCLTCPWHGSSFDVTDGEIVRGPAVRPQPVFDVKVESGQIFIRRSEPRSLRTNPA